MLRTFEPQKGAENKNAEADFKNPCSYRMKSVYYTVKSKSIFYSWNRTTMLRNYRPITIEFTKLIIVVD